MQTSIVGSQFPVQQSVGTAQVTPTLLQQAPATHDCVA
jgi:hypothetical protein